MQFGRVLAFATLVLASPTPQMANLEDRAVAISISGLAQSLNSAANAINNIAAGNVANIQAIALAGTDGTLNTALAATAAIKGNVTAAVSAVLSDIKDTVKNATAIVAQINGEVSGLFSGTASDGLLLIGAAANLVNSLKSVNLTGLLVVSAGLSSNAKQQLQTEIANVQNLVTPIVTALTNALVAPLTQLQATLTGSASTTLPSVGSTIISYFSDFLTQASKVIPTVSS